MANVHVRNLPDAVHRALRQQAAYHGRSTEAEIRSILEMATLPPQRVKLGSLLMSIGQEGGGLTTQEHAVFDHVRDKTQAAPMRFE